MRAKEYLILRRKDLYYYDIVKKAIRELYPLRFDKAATETYFNRYLFADARHRVEESFTSQEGEIDHAIALDVRVEILHVITEDDSFIYAYNIIAEGRNLFCNFGTMQLCAPKEEDIGMLREMEAVYGNHREDWQQAIENIVRCLLEHFNLQLTDEQIEKKDELWDLVKEFYLCYCKPYIIRNETDELKAALARKEQEIAMLKESIARLNRQLSVNTPANGKGGMTLRETSLVFYYLFNELGVNFSNSDKTQWARFIHTLTGKSFQRIRESLSIDFDRKSIQKNLRDVAALFSELFPHIENKILNDMKPVL